MTVSRVMRDHPSVSETTSKRIKAIATEMGYKSNRMARAMRSGSSNIIGFVMPDRHALGTEIFHGAYDYFHKKDMIMSMDLIPGIVGAKGFNEQSKLIDRLLEIRVDGIILLPVSEAVNEYYFNKLQERKIPVVCVDRDISNFTTDFVGTDDLYGSRKAADILFKNGCKNAVLITAGNDASTSRIRANGFREQAKKIGLNIPKTIECPSFRYHTEIIDQELRNLAGTFDSIFAVGDRMATSAWNSCTDLGLNVPSDVKIIGFGCLDISDPRYKLSSFDQKPQLLGQKAAKLLSAMIDDAKENKHRKHQTILNKPNFIEGISCPH